MTIGSLFAGIGGLELGLERAGLGPVIWQAEIDPFCRRVLAKHWPDVKRYDDVRRVDEHAERPDLICGGFPCQDISTAGKGGGLAKERSGLWYQFRRAVAALRPQWIVIENVHHGWRRWVPFVRGGLHQLGYASVPVRVRACEVPDGALHKSRSRCFIIADSSGVLLRVESGRRSWTDRLTAALIAVALEAGGVPDPNEPGLQKWQGGASDMARRGSAECKADRGMVGDGGAAHVDHQRQLQQGGPVGAKRRRSGNCAVPHHRLQGPSVPALVCPVHGLPGDVAGLAGTRAECIRALGNAVVPQVAEVVGRMIMEVMNGP